MTWNGSFENQININLNNLKSGSSVIQGAEVNKGKLRMHNTISITFDNEFDASC